VAITAASKNSVTDQGLESTCSPLWTFANIFFLSRKKKKKKQFWLPILKTKVFASLEQDLKRGHGGYHFAPGLGQVLITWLTFQEEAGSASAGCRGTCRSCERQMCFPGEDKAEAAE
jgi:hypothetical protein